MLKIARVYLDACGFRDGVFEQLLISALDKEQVPTPHVIHAPNGVGKTTILALVFSTFEPDRRKFLRTEINRQHKIEDYFLRGRLGVVAVELVREGANEALVRHIVGQVFWFTPASKGDEGEPGHRRFFSFEAHDGLTLEALPFRGMAGGPTLKTLDDFTRWAREMRTEHPGIFFSTESLAAWRKHLVAELGIDLRIVDVQRRFCAAEGGIAAAFLDFRTEQQFLEKIFGFMIPIEAAESVHQALSTGLEKIRGLPQRRDQLKELVRLVDAFAPFFTAAEELESAEREHVEDLKRLGRLYARCKSEIARLEVELAAVEGEVTLSTQQLQNARALERTLEGEALFLERKAAERRIDDAKCALEEARSAHNAADIRQRAVRATSIGRQVTSAERTRDELLAELDRVARDLAPDRARLGRAGAALHGLLESLAEEAERDAGAADSAATGARSLVQLHEQRANTTTLRIRELDVEIGRLTGHIDEHTRDRKHLERAGAFLSTASPEAALARLVEEIRSDDDAIAGLDLSDEELQNETSSLVGTRQAAVVEAEAAKADSRRLVDFIAAGRVLEGRILGHDLLPIILAGEARDPYRLELPGRVRAAKAQREEVHRSNLSARDAIADELAFLDAEGISSVPDDVAEVSRALKESGFPEARAAEHYLAEFKPNGEAAMALVRQDPARFTGVFVAKMDCEKLTALAVENRLKLKGPVLVSEATLDPLPAAKAGDPGIVFGPLSKARFNKQAAADEKARLSSALAEKETEVAALRKDLDALQSLLDDLRQLHEVYSRRRPDDLERDKLEADHRLVDAESRGRRATARLATIEAQRRELRSSRSQIAVRLEKLKGWKQEMERFAARYAAIVDAMERMSNAAAERGEKESSLTTDRTAAENQRRTANEHDKNAAALREKAVGFRANRRHYPETDGKPADSIGTLDDLIQSYKTAEHVLASKRDAQEAHISQRLTTVKREIVGRAEEYRKAKQGLTEKDLASFAATADLERAIIEADRLLQTCRDDVVRAETAANMADARSGPVIRKIREAEQKRGVIPIALPEFAGATVDACETAQQLRESQRDAAEREAEVLVKTMARLTAREGEIRGGLERLHGLEARANDRLPEPYRSELPDLALRPDELKAALDQLIERIAEVSTAIERLRETTEDHFERVRIVFSAEAFRRLEPQVAEHLLPYTARSAGAHRAMLQMRLDERILVVKTEIESQQRDQDACLEQLRQHVMHADDLLRRAMRCSRIPDHVQAFGGERILKIRRTLRDVSQDVFQHQLAVWLDEQAAAGRTPQTGAALAAELLSRVHGGRPLEIEILKPKRDAIQPYMRVDRMGHSGGEGVTVAMMLYTVIQKMAMDERTDGRSAASGGFLMLDNTFGMSNMLEHVVLQMTMAELLGIQLFVTTCSEDKHVVNMFPTITRLAQGDRVLLNGVPQYIRVNAGDYLFKESWNAA